MSWFGNLFKKTTPDVCTAHILDPIQGVHTQNWIIGNHISREDYDTFKDREGNVYVATIYEKGEPKQLLAAKSVWDPMRRHLSGDKR